ncbi:GNAT family N-acetyltransferase [Glycomyces sambucus]|uniref:GNAT family N-acetyltransferase n=1 Tax=Glycomyces sambucus TaxID=380244 RepID=UPI003CCBBC26
MVAADSSGEIRGILGITLKGESATIDTIAVHPHHQSQGIARALLQESTVRLRALKVATLDAWTRDDPSTLRPWCHGSSRGGHRRSRSSSRQLR